MRARIDFELFVLYDNPYHNAETDALISNYTPQTDYSKDERAEII